MNERFYRVKRREMGLARGDMANPQPEDCLRIGQMLLRRCQRFRGFGSQRSIPPRRISPISMVRSR